MLIPGYNILSDIYLTDIVSIYRCERMDDKMPVIVKILSAEYPKPEDTARLKHEYEILKNINIPGVVRVYGIEKVEHRVALILEDVPDAITLSEFISKRVIDLDLFLSLATSLAIAILDIHRAQIIHNDINPHNIIVTRTGDIIKIIDFSIATKLIEKQEVCNPEGLHGTLPYMSPEQTGRMNCNIDQRTDLYSLGVTYYEMLTGELPFQAKDPMEWVYCHVAKQPRAPHFVDSGIPETISNIVMKLLSKSPIDRYVTAYGLIADLERFMDSWLRKREAISFKLGEKDQTSLFQIPQKLYGREFEVDQITSAITRLNRGILLLDGAPGIGKTALVNEIHKSLIKEHGYFTSGKFELMQQNIPYFALIQAFQKLLRQVLSENQKRINYWKEQLTKALTPNAQIIIDVIPEVELLIGKQPSVHALPPSEAHSRFELTFFDFVRVFAKREHPLVIFIDDLQWSDIASLELLKQLLRDESLENFILIGAYRDNEITPHHIFLEILDELNKYKVPLERISVKLLDFTSIKKFIMDTLHTSHTVDSLAQLILEKTSGNPFFVILFLNMLYDDHYLRFDNDRSEWIWDIAEIRKLTVTENVVELLISKIEKLPSEIQEIVKVATCIGNTFDIKTLAILTNKTVGETAKMLWPAMQENLIISLSEEYKLILADPDYSIPRKSILYKFAHDRIQQAASSLLTENQRKLIAIKLARLLLTNTKKEEQDEILFDVLNRFNSSLEFITNPVERQEIAELNLRAGNRAKSSIAYEAAATYYAASIKLLDESAWNEHYQMMYDTYIGYAECLHLSGKFSQADEIFAKVMAKSKTVLDQSRVAMLQILSYTIQLKYDEAIQAGLNGLALFGVEVKRKPSVLRVIYELLKTKWVLRGKRPADILKLSVATDPEQIRAQEFMERIGVACYLSDPNLLAILCLRGLRKAWVNGYSAITATQYLLYASILIAGFGDYDEAYEYGKVALQIVEKFDDLRLRAIVHFSVNILVTPWKAPYRECFVQLNKVYQLGQKVGELLYTNFSAALTPQMMLLQGNELQDVENKLNHVAPIPEFTQNMDALASIHTLQRMIPVLLGDKPIDFFRERAAEFINNKIPYSHPVTYGTSGVLCLITSYIFEEWDNAIKIAALTASYAKSDYMFSLFVTSEYYFFYALTLLSLYQKAKLFERRHYLSTIKSYAKKLKRWSGNCIENYGDKYYLIQAGLLYIQGKEQAAMKYYDQAITLAREQGHIHIEAIANELIGRIYYQKNLFKHAKLYLQEAAFAYQHWGADGKIKLLQERYPDIFTQAGIARGATITKTITHMGTQTSTASNVNDITLDLSTIMKSVQAISGQLVLEDVFRLLMKYAIENAGASRGLLLLKKDNRLVVVAQSSANEKEAKILNDLPLENSDSCCIALVRYVMHTQEPMVLNDAVHNGDYTDDPYILDKKPLSIACVPIMYKGQLLSILYLEHSLTTGAFSPNHLEVLRVLSAQAAISLENARLYKAYDQFVPHEFLDILGKRSIIDVEAGDNVVKDMTILFSDIRDFTALSEKLSPSENFQFVNEYISYMEPVIRKHGGFIDKFIGDAIMALFAGKADDAVQAGISMLIEVEKFNKTLVERHISPIRIGIGINCGHLMLGTLGGEHRMETSVISNTVNIASRVEDLTKEYNCKLLITDDTYQALKDPSQFQLRHVGMAKVRGKTKEVGVWEVINADAAESRYAKLAIATHYDQAIKLYNEGFYAEALRIFERCADKLPNDPAITLYIERCNAATQKGMKSAKPSIKQAKSVKTKKPAPKKPTTKKPTKNPAKKRHR